VLEYKINENTTHAENTNLILCKNSNASKNYIMAYATKICPYSKRHFSDCTTKTEGNIQPNPLTEV